MVWRTIRPFAGQYVFTLIGIIAAYCTLVNLAKRFIGKSSQLKKIVSGKPADALFLSVTFTLIVFISPILLGQSDKAAGTWLGNILATNPLMQERRFKLLSPAEFKHSAKELGFNYELSRPSAISQGEERKLNVLLIIMESSYNRYLSLFGARDETQPLFKKYRDRMELFPNFYSVFPNSFHGRFAVFSGIYPSKEYVSYINPRIECPSLFEILHDRGWQTSVFDSCYGDYVRLNDYLRWRKLDFDFDANNMPGRDNSPKVSWGVSETSTMNAIKKQMVDHANRNERFFITYTPVAPHAPFDSPDGRFAKFDAVGWIKGDYTGRYKNQLLYLDWIITSLIDSLKDLNLLDQTLVIITNDHGEMVGEDDGFLGHGWNLKPVLVNTPLIVMNPLRRGYQVNYTLGSQIDILPTTLAMLNIPLPSGEFYQGVSLYNTAANSNKVIYCNSYMDQAMISGGKYFLKPSGAPVTIFDITNVGVATVFKPTGESINIEPRMKQFEQFQNSLIHNYSRYQRELNEVGFLPSH